MEPNDIEALASQLIWQDPKILDSFDYGKIVQMIKEISIEVKEDMGVMGPTFSTELSAIRNSPRCCRCNESLEGREQPMVYAATNKEVYAAHICVGCRSWLNSQDERDRLKEIDILVLCANAAREGAVYG